MILLEAKEHRRWSAHRPEAGEGPGTESPHWLKRDQPRQHRDLGLPAPRSARQCVPVVETSNLRCSSQQPQEAKQQECHWSSLRLCPPSSSGDFTEHVHRGRGGEAPLNSASGTASLTHSRISPRAPSGTPRAALAALEMTHGLSHGTGQSLRVLYRNPWAIPEPQFSHLSN